MRRFARAFAIGLATAACGTLLFLTPPGQALEERFGLDWLFRLRGPIEPPADVAVVSLDRESRDRLGLPEKIREWPRTVHARLIERLADAGAAVVTLDLILEQRRADPAQDEALARAIERAGRVVLLEYLRVENRLLPGADGDARGLITTEQVVRPLPEFVDAARGLAPFPLPKMSGGVSQFWAFKPTVGGRPTLPVVALFLFARPVWPTWGTLLEQSLDRTAPAPPVALAAPPDAASLQQLMIWTRARFLQDPALDDRLMARIAEAGVDGEERRLLEALTRTFGGPDSRRLNFYGPAGQVRTLQAHRVLDGNGALDDVAGKAVFVGLSELINLHEDGFITVFSRRDGVDLSGVEIAATAFANLLNDRLIRPLDPRRSTLLLAGFGLAVGLIAGLLPALVAVPATLPLAAAHVAGAHLAFGGDDLWLPLVVPLLLQLPLGLFAGLLMQHREAQRARANITRGVRFYLPEKLAAGLAESRGDPRSSSELVYSTCLVSDAERFTSVAETMSPQDLTDFLNAYFELLFGVVKRHGGVVSDVIGDGMTSVWTSATPDRARRARACRAAIEIQRRLEGAVEHAPAPRLPTRIGLHSGWVVVGSVGGSGRLVYSVIGDIVNTAARIETLNKQLGTRLLATGAVVEDLDEFLLRPLGRFRVAGKTEALDVVEIVGLRDEALDTDRIARFADALACFQSERWSQAVDRFARLLSQHPGDGPARFYLHLIDDYMRAGAPEGDPTVVRLASK